MKLTRLQENIEIFRNTLKPLNSRWVVLGDKQSPILHLSLVKRLDSVEEEEKLLQDVVDAALKDGCLFTRAKYIASQERSGVPCSIRVCISAGHQKRDLERAGAVLRDCARKMIRTKK